MSDNSGKTDWKKRLEAIKQTQGGQPSQSADTSAEPPASEPFVVKETPIRPYQLASEFATDPHPKSELKPEPSPPEPKDGQLSNLKAQIRSLKIHGLVAACLAIMFLLGLLFMMHRGSTKNSGISADTLTIKDAKGRCRVWIGERDGQVQVELRDQAGKRCCSLGLGAAGEPRLIFYDKDQKILTEIAPRPDGQAGIKLLNQTGEAVALIPAPSPPPPANAEPQVLAPLSKPIPETGKVPQETPETEQKSDPNPGGSAKIE